MNWQALSADSHYKTAVAIRSELEMGHVDEATKGIEELVEALSRSEKRALKSQLVRLMLYIIKWKSQPERRSRSWVASIKDARDEIDDIQNENPSLNDAVIESLWEKAFVIAKRDAEAEMGKKSDVQSVSWEEAFVDEYDSGMVSELTLLQQIIENAIGKVLLNDNVLIQEGQELALSNRFAIYLYDQLHGWDVDCEYNRVCITGKQKSNSNNKTKRPDVIIHKRGLSGSENNLLWIELKIKNIKTNDDIIKLKEFTSKPQDGRCIQYKYGLSVSLLPSIITTWIQNGVELQ